MKLKPRFSKNKKSDALRFSIAALAFIALFSVAWNRISVPLGDVATGYEGFVLRGTQHQNHIINEEGVAILKEWLETKTRIAYNPISIVSHNIGHRKRAARYELIIGLKSIEGGNGFREYGIYQDGKTIYLQIEPIGSDRVLRTSFTAEELEYALNLYIEGKFQTLQTTDTDELHPQPERCTPIASLHKSPLAQLLQFGSGDFTDFFAYLSAPGYRKYGVIYRNKCR